MFTAETGLAERSQIRGVVAGLLYAACGTNSAYPDGHKTTAFSSPVPLPPRSSPAIPASKTLQVAMPERKKKTTSR